MIGESALHFLAVRVGLQEPATQTSPAERKVLAKWLKGAKTIVEIGVFEGFTTRVLAENADEGATIYGIDPFFTGRLGICWGERISEHVVARHLASGRVVFVKELSTQTGDSIPHEVDFVFVDGDHSLEGITADWEHWSKRVRTGGIIALHDSLLTPDKPEGYTLGSIEYFENQIRHDPAFEILEQQDSLSILRKR